MRGNERGGPLHRRDPLRRIAVIGLGRLGAPLAAVLASRGFEVIGVDRDAARVEALQAGRAPIEEPGLRDTLERAGGRLRATLDPAEAVASSDASFVVVPTPTGPDGLFSNGFVLDAVRDVGRALRGRSRFHLVNVTSTVMPGSTGGVVRAALEESSGRRVGEGLGLCYGPELVALGSVIRDLLFPDLVLVGESDPASGERMAELQRRARANDAPIERMSFVNAEIAKIAVNTFVTTRISFANGLAELCDHLPGADVDVVTKALGADSRIGPKFLKGALGYGGPCFPRDNRAFAAFARRLGTCSELAEATDRVNEHQTRRLLGAVRARLPEGGRVGILGLSYKPGTGVVEASAGTALALALAAEGVEVSVYDPMGQAAALAALGGKVCGAASAEACARGADLLVVTTPWPEFAELPLEALTAPARRLVILDPWRLLSVERHAPVADVVHLGRGARVAPAPDGPR